MYVENDDIKEKIIKGEVKGFSIEGIFQEAEDKRLLEKLKELLTNN